MNSHSSKEKNRNSFRIIAGTWRSRRLSFPEGIETLRPTTDRIRETLFNWLQQSIAGARCLDPFAGSGALAFEALSRGAGSVTAIDASPQATGAIRNNSRLLDCTSLDIVTGDGMRWLAEHGGDAPFDIVFLDPPYQRDLLPDCMRLLDAGGLVSAGSIIYMEAASPLEELPPVPGWELLRSRRAGQVFYGIFQKAAD